MTSPLVQFTTAFTDSIEHRSFQKLVVSQPCPKTTVLPNNDGPAKYQVRRIDTKQGSLLQWEAHLPTSRRHENLTTAESIARLQQFFPDQFHDFYLFTDTQQLNLRSTSKGPLLKELSVHVSPVQTTSHNRQKNHLIPDGIPCPFLILLGIMTTAGQVKSAKQKKFRQINRYLEIVHDIYPQLPQSGPLRIVDFGCGLSYLTFALHHLLTTVHNRSVDLLGIDQRPDVISRCQALADQLNTHGIEFKDQKIEDASLSGDIDLAVSLHACDTATDAALAYAVRANAKVILAAPCCQHELSSQIANADLDLILKHGILKERFAAQATDALRVAALEAVGYKSQILEFIDLEHTPKNLLIRAVRRKSQPTLCTLDDYHKLKNQLGLSSIATDQILPVSDDAAMARKQG